MTLLTSGGEALTLIVAVIIGYLLGSIPTAYMAGRWLAGIDITQHGSGNVGGTNTLRVLGPLPALLVIIVDIGKGIIGIVVAGRLLGLQAAIAFSAALGAVLGHNWSLYLKFKGGKGIAVTVGITLYLFWHTAWLVLLVAVAVGAMTRYVSLASLTYAVLMPMVMAVQHRDSMAVAFAAVLAGIAVWRHRGNIQRLVMGNERKISLGNNKKEHD